MALSTWSARRRTVLAVVAALVVALLAAAVVVQQRRAREQRLDAAARSAAQAFADGAQRRQLGPEYAAVVEGLGDIRPSVQVVAVRREGAVGTADLRWTWPFGPDGWVYDTQLPLAAGPTDDAPWRAAFGKPAIHPALAPGGALDARRTTAERGEIRGRGGVPLVTATPVVDVGVQPSRATDAAGLSRTLGDLLDVDAATLEKRIAGAAPDDFVPVITLRRSDYEPLKGRLQPLAGTVFREATRPLAPTREFARALLGTAGPVTAEVVEQSGGRLTAGDIAGLSGVQRTFDERLGGTAGVIVEQVQRDQRSELFSVPPQPGQPVELTLDPAVQQAAEAALAAARGGNGTASFVAMDVPSGDVLAVAGTPSGGANLALTGQYPPGSTFKAVSTLALLSAGLTPTEQIGCPPTTTVDGRSFRNFEGGALGSVPFRTAFAQSCNTAFVGVSDRLEGPLLPDAGRNVGLGVPWEVGVDVFAGDVPAPTTPVDLAAATIGQGRVLASPAAMAQVAATVARGSWSQPRLVVDPLPTPAAGQSSPDPADLAVVRDLMRAVVTEGTATALADVPGAPVHAKTGTAEYGTQSPPRTHAWTVGFQGDVAFAVLVEDGRSGGAVAVPVVEAFLRAL
jgi:cell division protein FtsI/penicillin-binding protein 2/type II secretory pathway pseudopilin PulG